MQKVATSWRLGSTLSTCSGSTEHRNYKALDSQSSIEALRMVVQYTSAVAKFIYYPQTKQAYHENQWFLYQ